MITVSYYAIDLYINIFNSKPCHHIKQLEVIQNSEFFSRLLKQVNAQS